MSTRFDIRRERVDALRRRIQKIISCPRKTKEVKFPKCTSKLSRIITNLAIYSEAIKFLSQPQVKGRTLLAASQNATKYRLIFAATEKT